MSQPRMPVSLPAYEAELTANQQTALRTAVLLAAPLVVAFTALDRATAPDEWVPLLLVRLAAAGILALLSRVPARISPVLLTGAAVAVICGTIEAGVFATGGATSPYLTSNIAVLAGVGILVPLTPRQALGMQLVGISVAVVPLLFRLHPGDALP